MTQRSAIGVCALVCWAVGLGAGLLAFWASVGAVTWLPAVLIGLALGAFVALVLGDLICGNAADGAEAVAATGAEVEAEAVDKAAARKLETDAAVAEAGSALADQGAASEGTKPALLDAPKGGRADDLKQIKGVGPKLEALLNRLGVYHFEQIAGWGAEEVAWVDANLEGFKGRVSRDDWVSQARRLAKGEVY